MQEGLIHHVSSLNLGLEVETEIQSTRKTECTVAGLKKEGSRDRKCF